MTDAQFTLFRFVAIPTALMLTVSWLLLPSQLQVGRSTETTAVVTRGTFKGQAVAYLQTPLLGELRVPCGNAPPLCRPNVVPRKSQVKVWVQKPGFLHDHWIVAAELEGRPIVTPEGQASHYGEAKWMWGLCTAFGLAIALALLYFAPFKRVDQNEA